MRILYLGLVGSNNINDKLILDSFKKLVKNKYDDEKCTIKEFFYAEDYSEFGEYDLVCLGGGANLVQGSINILYKALQEGKKVIVWGAGYDDLLEKQLINRIENTDAYPYLYSDSDEEKLNEIAKRAEFFGVRGPLTYKILQKSNIDMKNIVVSGDTWFLLEGVDIKGRGTNLNFDKRDKVVGINMGIYNNKIYGGKEEEVREELIKVCTKLLKNGCKLYLYSIWDCDLDIMLDMYKKLSMKENIIFDMYIHQDRELVSIIENCIFTINSSLHGNIVSAVANVPFISLGCTVKSYDFVKSIDCQKFNITTDSINMAEEIEECIWIIINYNKEIKEKISINIEKYKKVMIHYLTSMKEIVEQ